MRLVLIVAGLMLTAACDRGKAPEPNEGGAAAGRILGGDASDAMLPLDTVRSVSPPDPGAGITTGGETPTSNDPDGGTATPRGAARRQSAPDDSAEPAPPPADSE